MLTIIGTIPCGNDQAKKMYAEAYPKLVSVMGAPFTFGSEELIWKYDTTKSSGHGWEPTTNTVWYTPGDFNTCDLNVPNNFVNGYIRETAHLFYDLGVDDLNFGPQWLRQMNVGYAVNAAGIEKLLDGTYTSVYDRMAFTGEDRVNGVYYNKYHYGDGGRGSSGRSYSDDSATLAFKILSDVLGEDLLLRVNDAIKSRWKTTGSQVFTPENYAEILNSVSGNRKIDGLSPGVWLLKQPFSNSSGKSGDFLTLRATYVDQGRFDIGYFNRYLDASDGKSKETPKSGKVNVEVTDAWGDSMGTKVFSIPETGDLSVDLASLATLPSGASVYRVTAKVNSSMYDSNIYLNKVGNLDESLVIIPMKQDGLGIQPQLASRIQVTGSSNVKTNIAGALVIKAKKGESIGLSYGDWSASYTVTQKGRVIPIKFPNSSLPLPEKTKSSEEQTIYCKQGSTTLTIKSSNPICPSGSEQVSQPSPTSSESSGSGGQNTNSTEAPSVKPSATPITSVSPSPN